MKKLYKPLHNVFEGQKVEKIVSGPTRKSDAFVPEPGMIYEKPDQQTNGGVKMTEDTKETEAPIEGKKEEAVEEKADDEADGAEEDSDDSEDSEDE